MTTTNTILTPGSAADAAAVDFETTREIGYYRLVWRRFCSRRVALVGDAAFLARPHVAAGVTKAAADAMALASALQANDAIDPALARFEAARMGINRQVMQRGRDLGTYLQPELTGPEERRKAERHRTPQAVMSEIAVLDFLRS